MDEVQILGFTMAIVTTIAIITIAFNVAAIKRMLAHPDDQAEARGRQAPRP